MEVANNRARSKINEGATILNLAAARREMETHVNQRRQVNIRVGNGKNFEARMGELSKRKYKKPNLSMANNFNFNSNPRLFKDIGPKRGIRLHRL